MSNGCSSFRQQRLVRLQSARYFYSAKSRRDAVKFERKKLIKNKLRSLSKLNDELNECQQIYLNICLSRIGEAHRLAQLIEKLEQISISTDKTSLKEGKKVNVKQFNGSIVKENQNSIKNCDENNYLINARQDNVSIKEETSLKNTVEKKINFKEDEVSFANLAENNYKDDKNRFSHVTNKSTSSDRIKMLKDSIEDTISKLADLSNSSSLVSLAGQNDFAFENAFDQGSDHKSSEHARHLNQFNNQDHNGQFSLPHSIQTENRMNEASDKESSTRVSKQTIKKNQTLTDKINSQIEDTVTISNLDQLFRLEEESILTDYIDRIKEHSNEHSKEANLNELKIKEFNLVKSLNTNFDKNDQVSLEISAKDSTKASSKAPSKAPSKALKIKSKERKDLKAAINLENLDTDNDFYSLEQEDSEQDYKISILESKKGDLIIERDRIKKVETFYSVSKLMKDDKIKNFENDNLVYHHKKYVADHLDENLTIRTPSLNSLDLFSLTDDLPNFAITPSLSSASSFLSIDLSSLDSSSSSDQPIKCPKCCR